MTNLGEMKPEWRTDTVVQLCQAVREAQDFSQLPILADALQDAGCDNDRLLSIFRKASDRYAVLATLTACVLSSEHAAAVLELEAFAKGGPRYDCPDYEVLLEGAVGIRCIPQPNYDDWAVTSENDGEYLFFRGSDAHGDIPSRFWDLVEKVSGRRIDAGDRAPYFSCSC